MRHLAILLFIGVGCLILGCGKQVAPPQEMVDTASQEGKIESLIAQLEGESQEERWEATQALGRMGEPAVAALIEALGGESLEARSYAALALGQIGEPAVPALIEALNSESLEVRNYAVLALSQIGSPEALSAVEQHKNSNE